MSRPELQTGPNGSNRETNDMIAAPPGPTPLAPINLGPPEESHTILSPPPAASLTLPTIPQTSKESSPTMSPSVAPLLVTPTSPAVSVPPHLITPTPVIQMASASQATTSAAVSKPSPPPPSCSTGTSCSVTAAKSVGSMTPVPRQTQGPHQLPARLGSSPGVIFFSCVVGFAIFSVLCAILSCALRRWRNKRQQRSDDRDAWQFLENAKGFSDRADETADEIDVKSSHFGNDFHESNLSSLQPMLGFASHQQRNLARCHFADFQTQPPQHISSFIDEQGMPIFIDEQGVGWVVPAVGVSAQYNSLMLTPHGPNPEANETYSGGCAMPEPVFRKTTITGNRCNRSTLMHTPSQTTFARPASVAPPLSKSASKHQTKSESLTPGTSPEQPTAVERASQGIAGQPADLRATLRGAIQRKNDSDEELLESLMILWHDKSSAAPTDTINLPTSGDLPVQDQLETTGDYSI
ncbi:hypothetical protein PTTG_30062 [Puccinia triticina 1-1 BBBD Race 1]|uniref:Uncharacterized protein n=2 Tax=Puccinia triticina TaxID=208348 RepID=A0A180G0B4_PUCT1|nr:uncharacterized protein PtA15_6A859 [Puccinia triticina]OAV86135.1 hypothetical protein PTTG_30062 [Puccinia triticina 1-1 BBBD Race 1]WAQ86227.1 hypothetical protein PtA15_6A859 [Puccinia triticina]WAR56112.1 hypothetical protein PtB15_6B857 [Puccinia triticina]